MSRLTRNAGKSKKDFKPKAPLRRLAAPGSSQSSVRGSVERQVQSQTQTPQPSGLRPIAIPDTVEHGASILSSSANQHETPSQPAPHIPPVLTPISESSQPEEPTARDAAISTGIERTVTTPIATPAAQKVVQPQALNPDSVDAVAISIPNTRQPVRRASPAPAPLPATNKVAKRVTVEEANIASQSSDGVRATTSKTRRVQEESSSQPAAKRRKVNPPKKAPTPRQPAASEPVTISDSATAPPARSIEPDQEPDPAANTTENGAAVQPTKVNKKRQPAKAKGNRNLEEIVAAIVEDATQGGEGPADSATKRKKKAQGQRKRAKTPEDAETAQIEPGKLKMADLCKDTRKGKKSKRERALQARDEEELLKKQQQQQEQQNAENDGTSAPAAADGTVEASIPAPVTSETRAPAGPVPGVRIVNGQLVLDETTRTIDRVALANEARGDGEEVVVVDSLSHKVNSGTYGKRERNGKWNEEMTDRFYDGLRMFGTDFGMICKMFPGRSRRTIKLKFNHEERLDNEKIRFTLTERIPVDMEVFSEMSRTTYREKAEIEREMAEDRKKLEEEQAKEKEERDKVTAERIAEAAAEAAAGHGGDSSAKENDGAAGVKGRKGGGRGKGEGTKIQKKPPPVLKPKPAKVTKALAPVR